MSKFNFVNLLLIAATLVGGVLAWQTGRVQRRLRGEYERLSLVAGDLPIGDASKVHVRALPTGEPLHFAWRVYVPANYNFNVRDRTGSGNSFSSNACEFIARVNFREDEQGNLQAHSHLHGGSSRNTLSPVQLGKLLHNRWDKIRVEQLGADGVVVLDPKAPTILLRLTLSDDMQEEARKMLPPDVQQYYIPVLSQWEIGPR